MTTYDPIYLSETEHSLLDHSDVPGVPQSGASESPIATPYTTETMANPAGGTDDMTVLVMPSESPFLAVKMEGDDFPRLLWIAGDGFYFGDGTTDPWDGSAYIGSANGKLTLMSVSLGPGTIFEGHPTGVAVTAEAIHAALVTLGLIEGP